MRNAFFSRGIVKVVCIYCGTILEKYRYDADDYEVVEWHAVCKACQQEHDERKGA
jgi:hypothetical protein